MDYNPKTVERLEAVQDGLMHMFTWMESPEGSKFWGDVYDKIGKHLTAARMAENKRSDLYEELIVLRRRLDELERKL